MKMHRVSGILAGVAALPFLVASGIALAAPTQTGQGIMVNLQANGTFAITQTDTYEYNEATAATYFTNAGTKSSRRRENRGRSAGKFKKWGQRTISLTSSMPICSL
jgi:hypothetical protein